MRRRVRIELERRKPTSVVPLSAVLAAMKRMATPPVLESLLKDLAAKREIVRRGDKVGLPTGAELSNKQRQMLEFRSPTPRLTVDEADEVDAVFGVLEELPCRELANVAGTDDDGVL